MKTSLLLSVMLACLINVGSLFAQDGKDPLAQPSLKDSNPKQDGTTDGTAAQTTMEKTWMEFMTPGDMHKLIATSNGNWIEETTMWMAPGAPPVTNTGTCQNMMVLDGRYQVSVHSSTFNGQPFEGRGLWGYNNATKKFETTWIDNMGTGIMYMDGTWNEKTRTITFKGKSVDPMTGKMTLMRELYKMIDDNNQTIEMYETKDGKENKVMAIKLTRNG